MRQDTRRREEERSKATKGGKGEKTPRDEKLRLKEKRVGQKEGRQ